MTITPPTIFALSSGRPPAAIAVVRISGSRAGAALEALAGRMPEPRRAMFARVRDPQSGEPLDEALALWFPGPASETGEDMAELQLHGGRAVLGSVFDALGRMEGVRPAEAGEFTRRAFENGKLDLTRVEGLADLIGADTQAQRRQALRQLQGMLSKKAEEWRRLIEALALVEAQIDFPEEEDVARSQSEKAFHVAREVFDNVDEILRPGRPAERLRDGLVVAVAGPPNAGKSSLVNALAQREVAIVTPVPGTTRDVIEVHLDIRGYPVMLLDTAGLRESVDAIEQEGIRRALARAAEADLVLWVTDVTAPLFPPPRRAPPVSRADDQSARPALSTQESLKFGAFTPDASVWVVCNKIDLKNENLKNISSTIEYPIYNISVATGKGIDVLIDALGTFADQYFTEATASPITRARHRTNLMELRAVLARAVIDPSTHGPASVELFAEELRLALRAIGRLTGRVDVEEVLDVIFRDFCIGK
jgi:tRNA modification GTPase